MMRNLFNNKFKKLKSEKGSITVFVLANMLFMLIILAIFYMSVSSKSAAQKQNIKKIREEYEKSTTTEKIEEKYNRALEKAMPVVDGSTRTMLIYFNNNTGSGNMDNQTFIKGVAQQLETNTFTKAGYKFVGWNTEANGTGTSYINGQSITFPNAGTLTLYAQWEIL